MSTTPSRYRIDPLGDRWVVLDTVDDRPVGLPYPRKFDAEIALAKREARGATVVTLGERAQREAADYLALGDPTVEDLIATLGDAAIAPPGTLKKTGYLALAARALAMAALLETPA